MSRLEIILSAILFISILFNVGVSMYARAAIVRLLSVSEELGDLKQMVDAFAKHIQSVYKLEMFYGDQTLQALMNHAVSFNEQLDTFEYIYSLTEEGKIITDDAEDDTEENEEET
tara:strand:- start:464 stop:808 length:345 start_codon:yes stop_codon:yes gene_type:complete